jgi:hypothetical protein
VEPNHLKSEGLLPEVGGGAEADGQVDPPDGLCSSPWHNSIEALDARSELHPLDPQEVEGLDIDNVEVVISVHEHLGEARIGDDGIDDERVHPKIGDVV